LWFVSLKGMTQDAHEKDMAVNALSLPGELSACHALIVEQARAITEVAAACEKAQRDAEALRLYAQQLINQLYGRRSERTRHDPRQGLLDFGSDPRLREAIKEAAAEAEGILETYTMQRRHKKQRARSASDSFPDWIPRQVQTIEPDPRALHCEEHGAKELIGYDEVPKLYLENPSFYLVVRKYAKYACVNQSECGVTQAPRPTGLVEGDRYDTSVAAAVLVDKFAYHLPLYREQDRFSSYGWTPSRSTLGNLIEASTFVAAPFVDYMRAVALAEGGLGCDDTTVTLVVPPVPPTCDPTSARSQRTHDVIEEAIRKELPSIKARVWAYRPFKLPLNVFDFTVSRHREGPAEFLANYQGLLMGDCYSGFNQIELHTGTDIVRAACWAHARRKVFEIRVNYPIPSSVLLASMAQLYDIEDRAKTLTDAERSALRRAESQPVLDRIREYIESNAIRDALPKSGLAEAANYLRNHWDLLQTYVAHGECPIDNNDVEQLMKQVATGRKNWLFICSVAAGERAAMCMTLVSSALRNDLNVTAYIKDLLDQLLAGVTDYESLLPHNWKLRHPEAIRTYRVEERRDAVDRRRLRRAQRRIDQRRKIDSS